MKQVLILAVCLLSVVGLSSCSKKNACHCEATSGSQKFSQDYDMPENGSCAQFETEFLGVKITCTKKLINF